MPGKKNDLNFSDLGLDVALPSVLSKSREERKREQLEKKKQKKEREKEALEIVASSREIVQKWKRDLEAETEAEKNEREQRKKKMKIEHIKSRAEREQRQRAEKEEALVSQSKVIAKIQEEWNQEEEKQKAIQTLLEQERERAAQQQPRNVHITICRTDEMERQRSDLPVVREEQPIMEAINAAGRSCVLISGETGSGKTTQIPQFLWEAGYGHQEGQIFGREGCILVTEPRRVAAVSMARRVAEELNVEFGGEVCYHVRYDNNLSDRCKIKFATEGIVLKEIQSDFLLKKYSVIIVDEAHERSLSCDILVGLLSRIVPLRNDLFQEQMRENKGDISKVKIKPLKLVIMSATLHIGDFRDNRKLFPVIPPLIQVDARRFPVANHFARKTQLTDYVDEAFKKVRQIHKKLPPGGILVFLTTQREIEDLCDQLRRHYRSNKIEYSSDSYNKHAALLGKEREEVSASDEDIPSEKRPEEEEQRDEFGLEGKDYALDEDTGRNVEEPIETLVSLQSSKAAPSNMATETDTNDDEVNGEYDTLHVLPLYALLDFQLQQEVFKPPPPGKRLCVVATNVAETSLTIPNIKYVVDAGRAKVKMMEEETKASCYRIDWVSQASAEQRSGRAGRMGPGHCYRLYSTAVYSNLMPKHTTPEILRTPLDTVVLLMKQVGIQSVNSFPFPSPPKESEIQDALRHLVSIGALDAKCGYRITPMGRRLVTFPLPPRFARAIMEAVDRRCTTRIVEMICAVVATVSTVTSVFTAEGNRLKGMKAESCKDDPQAQSIKALLNPGSDMITYLNAFAAYYTKPQNCWYLCMVQKSMQEARMLFQQVRAMLRGVETTRTAKEDADTDEVADTMDEGETIKSAPEASCFSPNAPLVLNRGEELMLRRLFIPGLLDQVARRATVFECRSMGAEYMDKKTSKAAYLILSSKTIAYVHPTSSIAKTFPPPEYLTFSFLQKTHRSESKTAQTMMLGVTIVTKEWLMDCGFEE
eukprot:gene5409-3896_t